MSFFVTGIDTGVGKTHTIVQLLRLLRGSGMRCAGMKPICCGDRRDAELLLAAGMDGLTINEVNPLWLKTPAAPFKRRPRHLPPHSSKRSRSISIFCLALSLHFKNALIMFSWKVWEAGSCRFAPIIS